MSNEGVEATRTASWWESRYQEAATGWDLGGPTGVLASALDLGLLGPVGRALVPGAGRGHDAFLLAERGWQTTAVDFAQSAVDAMRVEAERRGVALDARQADVFSLLDEEGGRWDAAFEYTCFVAIDPALRARYVEMLTHVIRPGGRLLFLAFPLGKTSPGPPHGLTVGELQERFRSGWRWVLDTEAPVSVAPRRPMERMVLLERLG